MEGCEKKREFMGSGGGGFIFDWGEGCSSYLGYMGVEQGVCNWGTKNKEARQRVTNVGGQPKSESGEFPMARRNQEERDHVFNKRRVTGLKGGKN